MRLLLLMILASACLVPLRAEKPRPPATTPISRGIVVMRRVPYLEVQYGADLGQLRKLKGMPEQGRGAWALEQIAAGRVASSFHVKALADTSAATRRSILEGLLRQDWGGEDFDPARPDVAEFLDYSGRILNLGDTFEYRIDGEAVWVRYQSEPWRVFRAPQLRQAVLRFNTRIVPATEEALGDFRKALEQALTPSR